MVEACSRYPFKAALEVDQWHTACQDVSDYIINDKGETGWCRDKYRSATSSVMHEPQ